MGFFSRKNKEEEILLPVTTTDSVAGKDIISYVGIVGCTLAVSGSHINYSSVQRYFSDEAKKVGANAVIGLISHKGELLGTAVIVEDKNKEVMI